LRFGAHAAKLSCKCLALGLVAAGNDDMGAVLGKGGGGGATDAGQGASDQDDWVAHIPILTLAPRLPAEHGQTETLAVA
jgi:hypothetical protein